MIAFGGGSGLDAAKAVAFMAGQSGRSGTSRTGATTGCARETEGIVPVVAMPTTAGTGSEVGRAAVITNEADHGKCIVFHPQMLPGQVIADPELTLGLPPKLTAWTGFDALSHSLEALCAPGFHPLADGIATEGIRLIHRWLGAARTAATSPRAPTCWRRRAWARSRSRKGSARCTRSPTRSAACSTATTA